MALPSHLNTKVSIESRLEHLERTVQSLASSVDEALHVLSATPSQRDLTKPPNIPNHNIARGENKSNSQLYIGPSHSFSFLQEAPADIERLPRQGLKDTRQGAISEIRSMSSSLTTAKVGNPMGSPTTFYVPSRPVGYALLGSKLIPPPMIIHYCLKNHFAHF